MGLALAAALFVTLLPATRVLAQEEEEPETVYPAMEAPPDYVEQTNERTRTACIITGACDQTVSNAQGQSRGTAFDPCYIKQNALRPCNSGQQQTPTPSGVDPNIVGVWQIPLNAGLWVLEIFRDGTYKFHSEAKDGVAPNRGTFSASNGYWSLKATNGWTDGGTYIFQAPDTWIATGKLGTGAWRHPSVKVAAAR